MSNASNLSTLANVLDDGTDGQFLKSTGSGGVAFDTVAAGAVVYATADLLPLSGFAAGDMAYVTATNRFYINNGSGWYSISLVNTNPNITSVADASSGTTPFTLATDQTATVITVTAADPEDVPLTYGYSVTSGSLNGSTVAQGTGSNSNVFTVTPHASQDATFTITFTASDGINQATSANVFSLSFVTIVTDSNHTTLLATATGTSDNNNITDSSSNSHSITVNGDARAGTFSPYRSGGYSTLIPNGDSNNLVIADDTSFDIYDGDFTVEAWLYPTSFNASQNHWVSKGGNTTREWSFTLNSTAITAYWTTGGTSSTDSTVTVSSTNSINEWMHICVKKSGSTLTIYKNGVSLGTGTFTSIYNGSGTVKVGRLMDYTGISHSFNGYISDLRIVKGTAITPPSGGPTERLEAVANTSLLTCHLPYITDGSTNDHSIEAYNDVSTEPFSPYDYEEYDAANHGGSVYFDPNASDTNYLTVSSLGDIATSQEFQIDFWTYIEDHTIESFWVDSPSTNRFLLYGDETGSTLELHGKVTSTDQVIEKQWNHICISRDSNDVIRVFRNGKLGNSATDTSAFNMSTVYFGGYNSGASQTPGVGYMSDIRVFIGSSINTSNFTPPTAPLSSSGASLHIKGTDASIIDKSQVSNLKLVGNTTGSTTQAKFSNTKSMYFDGTGDYLTTGNSSNLSLGTGALTVELWYYLTTSQNHTLFELHDGYPNGGGSTYDNNRAKMVITSTKILLNDGTANVCDYAETQVINQWRHCAWSRDASGNNRFYLNGTQIGTTTSSSNNLITPVVDLGRRAENDTTYMQGYIQDFRITNGLARYTANFTPPTAPSEG